jgi:PAS domain S-box-containing protein
MESVTSAVTELLEALPSAVAVIDADRRVVAWNAAAEVLYGFPRHEAMGQALASSTSATVPRPGSCWAR